MQSTAVYRAVRPPLDARRPVSTGYHEPTTTSMVQGIAIGEFNYQRWRAGPIHNLAF
jgi:hypothetical protein